MAQRTEDGHSREERPSRGLGYRAVPFVFAFIVGGVLGALHPPLWLCYASTVPILVVGLWWHFVRPLNRGG